MVKQRMSSADVAAEVACLRQRILGLRVANIYDLNAKVGGMGVACGCERGLKSPGPGLLGRAGAPSACPLHTAQARRGWGGGGPHSADLPPRGLCRVPRFGGTPGSPGCSGGRADG